jgi:MFS transporter, DHA1 family, inner membrane transport protein
MTTTPHNAAALAALATAYFTLGVASLAVIGLAEPIAHDLGVSRGAVAQLVTAFALSYAVAAPLLQMWVGAWDRRRLIVLGLAAIAAGSFAGAVASSFWILAASRIVMALGGALVGPMASAAGASLVQPERQGAALGIVFTGMTVATVLGVPVASFLGTLVGWQSVLGLTGALAVATMGLVTVMLPTGSRGQRTTGHALSNVLTDRTLAPAIGVTFFQMAAQFVTYAVIGAYLITAQDIGLALIPVALMIFGVGGIAGNTVATSLISRLGSDRLIVASLIALIVVFVALTAIPHHSGLALLLLAAWAVVGTVMMAPQQARLVKLAPHARNLVLALNASALYLGMAGGALLGGFVLGSFGSAALPLVSALVTAVAIASFTLSNCSGAPAAVPAAKV